MSGKLTVVGTGPGNPEQTTPEALAAGASRAGTISVGSPDAGRTRQVRRSSGRAV